MTVVSIPHLHNYASSNSYILSSYSSSNVINATGIKPHPLLSHVRVILEQDPASLNTAIELLPRKLFTFCFNVFVGSIFSPCLPTHAFHFQRPYLLAALIVFDLLHQTDKTKGAVGYLIQFDHILVTAIVKGAHK